MMEGAGASPAQTLVEGFQGKTQTPAPAAKGEKRKRLSLSMGSVRVKSKAAKLSTAAPGGPPDGIGRRFGRVRLRGGGDDNSKPSPRVQQPERKSIFFLVTHFFARG
jgi:hypothetical protein